MVFGKLMTLPVILFLHFSLYNHAIASPIPSSTPVKIDQRQEGETNVRADLSNIVVVVIPSDGVKLVDTESMGTLLQIFANRRRTAANKAHPPPSSPYKVDIEQSAIEKLHADMESLNSIIPASKTYDDKEDRSGESDIPATIKEEQNGVSSIVKEEETPTKEESINMEKAKEASSEAEEKKPEKEVVGDVKPEDVVSKDGATMSATTMEAIVSSVNSYSKNEGLENGEKLVKLQPASVTVILAKKPETSSDAPVVTLGEKKEPTHFVEIHKQSSSVVPSKDMPSPLTLTIEDLKRPIQVPSSEEMTGKTATPVKISPKDSKPQQRHHNHQHQQSSKPTKKTVTSSTEGVEQSPSPTAPMKTAIKSTKPEANPQEHDRKLKMLQSGVVFCMPGQKLNEDGECVSAQIRQSRREDMERLLAALRFGVGPAYRS